MEKRCSWPSHPRRFQSSHPVGNIKGSLTIIASDFDLTHLNFFGTWLLPKTPSKNTANIAKRLDRKLWAQQGGSWVLHENGKQFFQFRRCPAAMLSTCVPSKEFNGLLKCCFETCPSVTYLSVLIPVSKSFKVIMWFDENVRLNFWKDCSLILGSKQLYEQLAAPERTCRWWPSLPIFHLRVRRWVF